MAEPAKNPTIQDLQARVSELEAQISAAHADRVQAEADRDKYKARCEGGPIQAEIPSDLDDYKGEYRDSRTGNIVGLKIVPKDKAHAGRTHHVKSVTEFGDYTPEDFRRIFEKV